MNYIPGNYYTLRTKILYIIYKVIGVVEGKILYKKLKCELKSITTFDADSLFAEKSVEINEIEKLLYL